MSPWAGPATWGRDVEAGHRARRRASDVGHDGRHAMEPAAAPDARDRARPASWAAPGGQRRRPATGRSSRPPSRTLDITRAELVADTIREWKPTAVVHLAYRRDDPRDHRPGQRQRRPGRRRGRRSSGPPVDRRGVRRATSAVHRDGHTRPDHRLRPVEGRGRGAGGGGPPRRRARANVADLRHRPSRTGAARRRIRRSPVGARSRSSPTRSAARSTPPTWPERCRCSPIAAT